MFFCSSAEFLLPMRQRRVAAGSGLGTSPSAMIKYVRRAASGAAGNGQGTTAKYLRRTTSGITSRRRKSTVETCVDNTAKLPPQASVLAPRLVQRLLK